MSGTEKDFCEWVVWLYHSGTKNSFHAQLWDLLTPNNAQTLSDSEGFVSISHQTECQADDNAIVLGIIKRSQYSTHALPFPLLLPYLHTYTHNHTFIQSLTHSRTVSAIQTHSYYSSKIRSSKLSRKGSIFNMQFSPFFIALMAPLALAVPLPKSTSDASSLVNRSVGAATIHNNCAFDITVNPSFNGGDKGFETILAGNSWSQKQMDFGGPGQGVSLKINKVGGSTDNVAQFEYTVDDAMALVFYDLSLINGNPFLDYVQYLTANGAGPDVDCKVGEKPCAAAYTWAEQVATKAAPQGSNLDYYICALPK